MASDRQGRRMLEVVWLGQGWLVRPLARRPDPKLLVEGGLRFSGLCLLISAFALWLVPGAADPTLFELRGAASAFAALSGVGVYFWADRGFRRGLVADPAAREFRLVRLNARGEPRVLARHKMDEVESAFVLRAREPGQPSHLFFRLRGNDLPHWTISGRADELDEVNAQIRAELSGRPDKARRARGGVAARRLGVAA